MRVALFAVDSTYPNLALMKISAYHKQMGDNVEWYNPFDEYDMLYMSKIFSFTEDYLQVISNVKTIIRGGTGYDMHVTLPNEIERMQPDYSIYPNVPKDTAYGFLTRGCPNRCPWCVVPKKEGAIAPYMDVDEIAVDGRTKLVLMDNNILAAGDYGKQQVRKIIERGYRIDFNQAIDARLVTEEWAQLLAKVRWLKGIRFGCDTQAQIRHCEDAMFKIRQHGFNGEFFLYCILTDDMEECYERVTWWRGKYKVVPFCQPYRDINKPSIEVPLWQKDMARWANRKELYKSIDFKEYEARKGFKCIEYFYN